MRLLSDLHGHLFGYSEEQIATVRLEEGGVMTRAGLREVVAPALDDASRYCEDVAPIDFMGCLFVDSSECPVSANEQEIADGSVQIIRLRDFTPAPTID